ncbi:MAG: GIY-YIG nuclease family protein [Parasporobacterium sp.]|nr:GIY-YIG nuclease family protein [Parasporobacterium sp.]
MGKKYCVYVHTNKKDGKRYVGITSQRPEDRWANGKGYKENRHFDSAIKKYGWNNFEHEIPLRGLTRELACQWECALIAQYDSTDPAKGYNIALGGVGQNSVSTVTRKKMSDQTTRFFENHPEAREHLAELGRRQFSTYESKQAVSERMKKMFAEHPEKKATKAIRQYNLNGNYLRDWESAVLAEKDGGYDRKKISSCLTGHQKSACGYLWRYASKSGPTKIEGIPQKQKKPEKQRKCKRYIGVEQYDRKGNWIRSFDSVLEATQVAGVNHSCIIRCCRGRGTRPEGINGGIQLIKLYNCANKANGKDFG